MSPRSMWMSVFTFGGLGGCGGVGGVGATCGVGGDGCAPVSVLPNSRPPANSDGRMVVNNLLMADSSKQSAIRRERLLDGSPLRAVVARAIGIGEMNERTHVVVDV